MTLTYEREEEIRESFGFVPEDAEQEQAQAVELMAELDRLRAQTTWRPIAECPKAGSFLVSDGRRVMVASGEVFGISRRAGTPNFLSGHHWTHWMPLPPSEPTKERP